MLGLLIGAAVAAKVVSKAADSVSKSQKNNNNNSHNSGSGSNKSEKIKVGISSDDFCYMDYSEAINTLIGIGFKNITAKEIREYRNNFFNKDMYGRVSYVSINGEKEFRNYYSFPVNAYVVVAFHVFKDSPPVIIPELEKLNRSQEPERVIVFSEPVERIAHYCEYCGGKLDDSWTSCEHCGAVIK